MYYETNDKQEIIMKEQLQIVIRKNRRSGDLIQIARKSEKEKVFHSYQELAAPEIKSNILSDAELFEIEWFDQMVKFFLERTESHATDLERYRLFLPEKLYNAMCSLSVKCKEQNIDYRPMDSMIKSIINKIKATEIKLYEKTGQKIDVLSEINYIEPAIEEDKNEEDAKAIFTKLIDIPGFFDTFNRIAETKYCKASTIKIAHFKGYSKAYHIPPKWVYACAIDVIATNTNPLSIINENVLFVLWVKPSLRAGTCKQDVIKEINAWAASHLLIDKTKNYNEEGG